MLNSEYMLRSNVSVTTGKAGAVQTPQNVPNGTAVSPQNSILYFNALTKAGVPATLHIYPTGGHGWGYRPTFKYHDVMLNELAEWLKNLNNEK